MSLGLVAQIARFELRKRRRLISTYVYALVYFGMAFLLTIASGGAFSSVAVGVGSEKVLANSPYQIHVAITLCSFLTLPIVAGIFGQSVYQDFETRSDALFFTTPISPRTYLSGRFVGAIVLMLCLVAMLAVGVAAGSVMPFVERANFGVAPHGSYVWPYLVDVLPNLLFTGGIFFTMAALGRRMMPVYVAAVLLLLGYLIAQTVGAKLEHRFLAGMLDPFGFRAGSVVTEYWTVAEKNSRLMPFAGVFLFNRLLWSALGLCLFAFTMARFRFSFEGRVPRNTVEVPETDATTVGPVAPVKIDPRGHGQLLALCRLAFTETIKNVYFVVLVLAGVLFVIFAAQDAGTIYGTRTYPVTYSVIELSAGSFSVFILILLTFYSGELVWRERDLGLDQLLDATPLPTWKPFVAKLLALALMLLALSVMLIFMGIAIQTFRGYHHYELGQYFKQILGFRLTEWLLVMVLAVTVQSIVQHKYVGHLIMILYYAATLFIGQLGLENRIYRVDDLPGFTYSDMNGFGDFWKQALWLRGYWACLMLLLALCARALWVRGVDTSMGARWRRAGRAATPAWKAAALMACLGFAGLGAFIFYNTNILNHYRDSHATEAESARYEKKYRATLTDPQPKITAVTITVDLEPEHAAASVSGRFQLRNDRAVPVTTVWIGLPTQVEPKKLRVGNTDVEVADRELGHYVAHLNPPLLPGAETTLDFALRFQPHGFRNDGYDTNVIGNGTFFNSGALPQLGYQSDVELTEDKPRKKYGLPPKDELPDLDDAQARMQNLIRADADYVSFDATISTSPDQIAIAPGLLVRQWTENGRHYFQYRTEKPILDFFNISSGRYQVRRDQWKDVALEIYYHPGHEYDLDAMVKGMKASLEYCSTNFGPYPHHVLRILEFPRYEEFAQSFPNTIPYSEGIGFIARVDPSDKEDVDYPFYVTAHEVAHQWWAHLVVPARVQGMAFVDETMAQYSALMVMKHSLPESQMKRFLKYELDRYLAGRTFERKRERPLMRVESQDYTYYRKGSVAMYALQDLIGEDRLNAALREYVDRVRGTGPPYQTARDLLAVFRKATPPEYSYVIEDLFETITLYDNRALTATATKLPSGAYEVHVHVTAKKMRGGDDGRETEVPMNDFIDGGAVDDQGEISHLERRRVGSGPSDIVFQMPTQPAKAGLDPLYKLIDRTPDDNLVAVDVK